MNCKYSVRKCQIAKTYGNLTATMFEIRVEMMRMHTPGLVGLPEEYWEEVGKSVVDGSATYYDVLTGDKAEDKKWRSLRSQIFRIRSLSMKTLIFLLYPL